MKLTPSQKLAASNIFKSTSIIAGAGSGKTRVLTEYFKKLLREEIPLRNILAFTFTEKAALEILERLIADQTISQTDRTRTQISTIHSFCYQIIQRYSYSIDLNPEFEILSETENHLQKDHFIFSALSHELNSENPQISSYLKSLGFSKLKKIIYELIEYPHLDELSDKSDQKDLLKFISDIYEKWLEYKIKNARINFQDLEVLALKIIKSNPEIKQSLRKKYKHILVDEFQDTNPIQAELIELLFQSNLNHLFIVGDPKQSIYRFRNAKLSVFFHISQMIQKHGGLQVQLRETFRIPSEICHVIDQVFSPLFRENSMYQYETMISGSDRKGSCRILVHQNRKLSIDIKRKHEAEWIARHISEQKLSSEKYDHIAILFRSSSSMKIYSEALEKYNIPYQRTRSESLLDIKEISEIISIFHIINESSDYIHLISLLKSDYVGLNEIDLFHIINKKLNWKDIQLINHPSQEKWDNIKNQLFYWTELKSLISTQNLVSTIFENLCKIRSHLKDNHPQIKSHIHQFMNLCHRMTDHDQNLDDFIQQILTIRKSGQTISTIHGEHQNGVQLLTIHASKGLEFDQVYLPQLYALPPHGGLLTSYDHIFNDDLGLAIKKENSAKIYGLKPKLEETILFSEIKSIDKLEEREELKRLLYVAMTRVQSKLYLFLEEPKDPEKIDLEKSRKWNDWIWKSLDLPHHPQVQIIENQDFIIQKNKTHLIDENSVNHLDFQCPTLITLPIFSVTEVETWSRCEKEFELKYRKQIKPIRENKDSSPLSNNILQAKDWGNFIHEIFEFLDMKSFSNLETVIEQAICNQQISDPNLDIKKKATELIETLKSNERILDLFQHGNHQTELSFLIDFKKYKIRGTIDRLIIKENEVMIIDYKTEKIHNHEDLLDRNKIYQTQLGVYALATQKIINPKSIKTVLLFTDGFQIVEKIWNQDELDQTQENLNQFYEVKKSEKSNFDFTKNRTQCERCEYFSLNYCGVKN